MSKLFLENYRSASADEQSRTITILVTLYPQEFVEVAKLFHQAAASTTVRQQVQEGAAGAATITVQVSAGATGVTDAGSQEKQGFAAIVAGDLAGARIAFGKAYDLYPLLHNVDEIYHKVLTADLAAKSSAADPAGRKALVAQVAGQIVDQYSWGADAGTLTQLRALRG